MAEASVSNGAMCSGILSCGGGSGGRGMVTLLAGAKNSYGACVSMIGAMVILIVS